MSARVQAGAREGGGVMMGTNKEAMRARMEEVSNAAV